MRTSAQSASGKLIASVMPPSSNMQSERNVGASSGGGKAVLMDSKDRGDPLANIRKGMGKLLEEHEAAK